MNVRYGPAPVERQGVLTPVEQIADALGMTEQEVRDTLKSALRKCARRFGDWGIDPRDCYDVLMIDGHEQQDNGNG